MCTIPLMRHVCRESYNQPLEVYETLKRLGMDLVTVTDHDSIDAVESLRSRADFFLSEEVTCTLPSGSQLHVGVYDITERDHIELQRRRNDFESLLAWLVDQDLFFSANHVFSSLTGRRAIEDFRLFETAFPAVETLNGHMLARANANAAWVADYAARAEVGGSDAHAMASVGCAWTVVPGARNRPGIPAGPAARHGTRPRGNRRLPKAHARCLRHWPGNGTRKSRDSTHRRARMDGSVHSATQFDPGGNFCTLVDGTIYAILFAEARGRPDRRGDRMTLHGTMLNYISRRDHKLMLRINRWPAPALDPALGAVCHARRRWLALVWHGRRDSIVRRSHALPGRWSCCGSRGFGNRDLPQFEKGHRTQAALRF